MSWLTKDKKKEIIKKTTRNYVFSRVLLFISIALLIITIALITFSFVKTFLNYVSLHNSGMTSDKIWIEISHFWWSPIKVINEGEHKPDESIFISFSIFSYVMIGLFSFVFLTSIISIILVARFKSPRKIAPLVQTLDDDYWKRRLSKINHAHSLKIDVRKECIKIERMREKEWINRTKNKRKNTRQSKK